MRSEYISLEKAGMSKPRPEIVRAQIDDLCQEIRQDYNSAISSKFD